VAHRPSRNTTNTQRMACRPGRYYDFYRFIIIIILMTGTLGIRARDASLKTYGERISVDGDKYQVHLACVGNVTYTHGKRNPTIILEAGETPPPSMTLNTGPTVAARTALSHVIATGIGPVMRGQTMRLPYTLLGCLRMLSLKPSPVLERRGLGFLSRHRASWWSSL